VRKVITRNISLTAELDRFARAEMEEGAFPSLSAYFADLLRARRQAQIQADVTLLGKAIANAPEDESAAVPKILAAQKRARSKLRAA
jgi:Arc/MetJ-type ribon-helix-helix transcriptional regulator